MRFLVPVLACVAVVPVAAPARADPALDLCRELIVQTVKSRSTFDLIDSAFGKTPENEAFVRIHFDALSAEGYIMQGEGTCLFSRAEPTPNEAAACSNCSIYTFAAIRIDDDAVDLPMAEPRFSSGTSGLPR